MSLNSNKFSSGTISNAPLSPPIISFGTSSQAKAQEAKARTRAFNVNANVSIPTSTPTRPPTTAPHAYPHPHPHPHNEHKNLQHLYVLPVLLLEFLALALTRAVIPALLLQTFGDNVYFVMGCAECVRGLLAFVACPMFGKISDVVGRKACLFVTVLGTCSPVCSLAIMFLRTPTPTHQLHSDHESYYDYVNDESAMNMNMNIKQRTWIFVLLLALSGIFSSTFTLTFAYISDTVKKKQDRVTAYGLALATFGLSFTIGPMAGGYLAHVDYGESMSTSTTSTGGDITLGNENDMSELSDNVSSSAHLNLHPLGLKRVFCTAFALTILDLLYIYFILPESISRSNGMRSPPRSPKRPNNPHLEDELDDDDDDFSINTNDTRTSISEKWNHLRQDVLPNAWSPINTLKMFSGDPFMYEVGCIAFLYYTSLQAVVSTLMLYATKRFKLGPERLGELMSALGLSTMISEAVLVRIIVPTIGEKKSMRFGLAAFFLQCVVLGFAYEGWQLFICVLISMMGNLVYPSLTSLVSSAVAPEMVGEALGAINGVKALTEGVGPLVFGTLMTLSEKSFLPGWPYLVGSIFALIAYNRSANLPDEDDGEYVSERYITQKLDNVGTSKTRNSIFNFMNKLFVPDHSMNKSSALTEIQLQEMQQKEEEYTGLLSEIDEVDENELRRNYTSDCLEDEI